MKAYSFTKYTLAATVRKEGEPSVTSRYDAIDPSGTLFGPGGPLVHLDQFLDGESIDNADIVLWANIGVHHMPHAEDVPTTPANTNNIHISLIPTNYFDADDSYDLGNMVYIEPSAANRNAVTVDIYGLQGQSCPLEYFSLAMGRA